ncbi:hypothetical protein HMF7854_07310 [Sphingomonas ginkgonis]|uniref:C-deglycosylation enzyme beta subunit n=1 Tax=Sphingomonas ginkgonis TaxID=2315330 RepID=A0A3R9Z642_9SPHN|nr:DUF6379 domain-containing protein [Sphingomonas ginkgonis]RST30660.1 hypothetical protein HMF7854_07310 [Sphingomonas ginkgonis]
MFEKYLIVEDSLRNVAGGFEFQARLGYYRGLGLSMVEDLAVAINGAAVPREAIRFNEGKGPLRLAEMETAYDRRWGFGEPATISVDWPEPLAAGAHRLALTERLRVSYMPFPSIRQSETEVCIAG